MKHHRRTRGRAPRVTAQHPAAADRSQKPTPRCCPQQAARGPHAPPDPAHADRAHAGQSRRLSSQTTTGAAPRHQTKHQSSRTRRQTPRRTANPPARHRSNQSRSQTHRQSHRQTQPGGHRGAQSPIATTLLAHTRQRATAPHAHRSSKPRPLLAAVRPCGTVPSKQKPTMRVFPASWATAAV